MSLKIDTNSYTWKEYREERGDLPKALEGCYPYVRNEDAYTITSDGSNDYYNIDEQVLRCKFLQLSCTTLLTHTIGVVATVAFELFHALTLTYFVDPNESLLGRLKTSGLIVLHVLSIPLTLVALQVIAMVGVVAPERARPWYVTGEAWIYSASADIIGCKGYRPLYHFLTLPLHTERVVDNYDKYLSDRTTQLDLLK